MVEVLSMLVQEGGCLHGEGDEGNVRRKHEHVRKAAHLECWWLPVPGGLSEPLGKWVAGYLELGDL